MNIADTKYTLLALGVAAFVTAGCADEGVDPTVESPEAGADIEEPADEGFGDEGIGDEGFGDEGLGDTDVADEGIGDEGIDVEEQTQAAGGDAQGGQYPPFEEVDTDADGQIGRTELATIEGLDFADVDTDQDGNVSRQEYMQATEQQQGQTGQQGNAGQPQEPQLEEEQQDEGLEVR